MKVIRKLFLLVVFTFLTWGAIFVYNRLTDGFNTYQIHSSLPNFLQFSIQKPEGEEKELLLKALSQPFHYLGKGCQFYAFESQDSKYVLKLLKHKHLRQFSWLKWIPAPQKIRKKFSEKMASREERVLNLFTSCLLAYQEMREETGLIFIHLNREPLFGIQVLLKDKLGLKHLVSIDDYEFVLQKKAVSLEKSFENMKPEDVSFAVEELMRLVKTRCEKGICDRDRSFVQNVAFIDDDEGKHAIFVDIGQFYKDSSILSEEAQKKDLQKRLSNLFYWSQKKFPEYVPLVEAYTQATIK